ncbi:MAG: aspartate aminotransferase [Legionellales bacterium]|nr:aspartate aminotransferase [Legionellales bacterium]|tara:strand:+ start:24772 stop:25923 length:1152 start_codon:yes stop_codon:yes gene_type:complete
MKLSDKAKPLQQSGIRNASVRCAEIGGINLGQGVCDLPIADSIKEAAFEAIRADKSIYSPAQGVGKLRHAIAEKINRYNNIPVDETNILVSHGATGGFVCAVNCVFNPGDDVIVFEPFYGYHKKILDMYGISTTGVDINMADLSIDLDQVRHAIGPNTKGIIICTPNNPTGKVYSEAELTALGELAREHDLIIITDEIYEYITYPGHQHVSLASMQDFKDRTITISGFSKTYNMTGWRLGYVSAPANIIDKMALVQDLLYVCPSTPLQYAMLAALSVDDSYYSDLSNKFYQTGQQVVDKLAKLGFKLAMPQGAYYIMTDFSELDFADDKAITNHLLEHAKVAVVPGSSFFIEPARGKQLIRVCYALQEDTVLQALGQIEAVLA